MRLFFVKLTNQRLKRKICLLFTKSFTRKLRIEISQFLLNNARLIRPAETTTIRFVGLQVFQENNKMINKVQMQVQILYGVIHKPCGLFFGDSLPPLPFVDHFTK